MMSNKVGILMVSIVMHCNVMHEALIAVVIAVDLTRQSQKSELSSWLRAGSR